MARIIATDSCPSQPPFRADVGNILQPMLTYTKLDFSARLNSACSDAKQPIQEGRGRRSELRRRVLSQGLKVSGEAVRKWLSGETIPSMDNIRFIAIALDVEADWLLTGRRAKNENDKTHRKSTSLNEPAALGYGSLSPDEALLLKALPLISEDLRESWLNAARKAVDRSNDSQANAA